MEYYWRKHCLNNKISSWENDEDNGLYAQWIRSYFQQSNRDYPILVTGLVPTSGEEKTLRCIADNNYKITGITFDGIRIEIIYGYTHQIQDILQMNP